MARKPKEAKPDDEALPPLEPAEKPAVEVLDKPKNQVAAFNPFYSQLIELEANNKALVFDYASKEGNKEARSHIFSLRKTKAFLEGTRKDAKEEYLRLGRAVDSEAGEIKERIEAMIDVHQSQIDRIEKLEQDRIDSLKTRLAYFDYVVLETSAALKERIQQISYIPVDESWAEFIDDAAVAKSQALERFGQQLAKIEKQEAEAAELAELRKLKIERDQQLERERLQAEAVERERQRVADQQAQETKRAADAIAAKEHEAAEAVRLAAERERQAIQAAEDAKQRLADQQRLAEVARQNAANEAARQQAAAVEREKQRQIDETARQAHETAQREANVAHCRKINRAASEAFIVCGLTEDQAKACVIAIAKNLIPNVSIKY